jgi:hypothetical protein
MRHFVFIIVLKTKLSKLDFFIVFKEFKAREFIILFSVRLLLDFYLLLFFLLNMLFLRLFLADAILLKLGKIIFLPLNALIQCLNLLFEVIYSILR